MDVYYMIWKHPWIPATEQSQLEMLKSIGKKDFEDLFSNIPKEFRLKRDLDIPDSHTEIEVTDRVRELTQKNRPSNDGRVFLGAGVAPHYVPTAVSALGSRSEFVTAYTSYQPEISQGMLQTLFEYQSLMAELLEIDVVNSSMYDMATALAEAIRMAVRVKKRDRFLLPSTVNPEHHKVALTYTEPVDIQIDTIDHDPRTGLMSLDDLETKMDDSVAGIYIENPSYLGFFESQVDEIVRIAHSADALVVAGVDILSLGLIRPPGSYGADIVISEGQPLGVPMSFGGPLLGIFGCINERKLVFQMPGRLVGLTRTEEEPYDRGFILTISAREQHIRREKATSNICSNQALMAVQAAIYTSLLGKTGFKELGETILYKSHYAAKQLNAIDGVTVPAISNAFWKEFVVKFDTVTAEYVHKELLKRDLHGGLILSNQFPDLGESMLFCITEIHSKETIDELVSTIAEIVGGGR